MNYFLAIYLGISVVTIFTNTPVTVVATEFKSENQSNYLEYSDYNKTQEYFREVALPLQNKKLEIEKQKQIELEQQIAAQKARHARELKKAKQKTAKKAPVVKPVPVATTSGSIESLIYYWTSVYGGDAGYHIKIARCESGLNSNSVGGGGLYLGVYQQHAKYWPARAARYGFAGASAFDANANVAVSIAMMRAGMYSHWGCA